MQTTLENNRPKFRNKILSKYCETAVFVGECFSSHTLYIFGILGALGWYL